jgi:hypothetical protein
MALAARSVTFPRKRFVQTFTSCLRVHVPLHEIVLAPGVGLRGFRAMPCLGQSVAGLRGGHGRA